MRDSTREFAQLDMYFEIQSHRPDPGPLVGVSIHTVKRKRRGLFRQGVQRFDRDV
ncbi:hypothetical protein [Luteibacter aegosomatissinici]|jgi:hypothetical protein|uniref:hypothetical protein n=1 Tax=Luteibacter TaxID=242605 RepID=UPI001FFB054D|nr:hypothetical protein [Luteibacter aegosomatissinici]UPG96583.1 hypothetical protein L2Y97_10835 [Luteibacter aegosomatissinici]